MPQRDYDLNVPAVAIIVGFFVLVISIFADVLGFGESEGFGWEQWTGVALSGVLVLTGGIMQIPTILAVGLITGAITILADWLKIGDIEGFGSQQAWGSVIGASMVVFGVIKARLMSKNDS